MGDHAAGTYSFLPGFFGLADIPAEFQKAMDRTFNNAKNIFWFLDDISLVTKGAESEHKKLVTEVLEKLNQEIFSLKLSECNFHRMKYIGWDTNCQKMELRPKLQKTQAILKLEHPKSLKQLRTFLGSIKHLSKLIANAAILTDKLRPLLQEENEKKN